MDTKHAVCGNYKNADSKHTRLCRSCVVALAFLFYFYRRLVSVRASPARRLAAPEKGGKGEVGMGAQQVQKRHARQVQEEVEHLPTGEVSIESGREEREGGSGVIS